MSPVDQLLLEGLRDLRAEIHDFGKELRADVVDIKETQARMDERLKSLEKREEEDECVKKRLQALEAVPHSVKSDGRKGKSAAITISLAGVGTVIWALVKTLSGSP